MSKRVLSFLFAVAGLALLAFSQAPPPPAAPQHGFNLQFTLHDTGGSHAVLDRTYTLWVREGGSATVDSGRKIPIAQGGGQVTYQSIGLTLNVSLPFRQGEPGHLALDTHLQISTLVTGTPPGRPSMDSVSSSNDALVPVGQRVTIAHFQTLASGRTYDLSVLAEPADAPSPR